MSDTLGLQQRLHLVEQKTDMIADALVAVSNKMTGVLNKLEQVQCLLMSLQAADTILPDDDTSR